MGGRIVACASYVGLVLLGKKVFVGLLVPLSSEFIVFFSLIGLIGKRGNFSYK